MALRISARLRTSAVLAVPALPLTLTLALAPASVAVASWSAQGPGGAAGAATVMPAGATPVGRVAESSVTVSWPASTLPGGAFVGGYVIHRYDAVTFAQATVGSGCNGVVAATTCTEQSVQPGTWVYSVTPVQLSWTGAASPDSASVVVP
jgi:hypothetical protein